MGHDAETTFIVQDNDQKLSQVTGNVLVQSCCAICRSAYREGEVACLSSNRLCKHVYHADCVMPWLLERKRNDCPLCRRNFLKTQTS